MRKYERVPFLSPVSSRFIFVFALSSSQFRGPDYLGTWNRLWLHMNTHAAFSSQNVGASIQPGIRMWDPLHWNYTELILASPQTSFGVRLSRIHFWTPKDVCGEAKLIPAGAKLACEYSRLSSLSPALGRSAKSLSGVERLWEATVFEQEAKAKQLTTELTEWQEDGVDGHTVHAEKCAGDNVSTNSDDLSRKIKIPLALGLR